MNKAKTTKILITLLCFCLIVTASTFVFADGWIEINPDTSSDLANATQTIGEKVTGILQVAGIVLSVAILMVLGIKYMMGSAEEKAEYKKTFIPYIIGAIILFAASALAKQIYTFAKGINWN